MKREKLDLSGPLTGAGLELELCNYTDQGEITALRAEAGLILQVSQTQQGRGTGETCGVCTGSPRQRLPSHTISCHQSSNFTLALHPSLCVPLPPLLVWMVQPGGKTTFNPLSSPFRPNWQMTALRLSDCRKRKGAFTGAHPEPRRGRRGGQGLEEGASGEEERGTREAEEWTEVG